MAHRRQVSPPRLEPCSLPSFFKGVQRAAPCHRDRMALTCCLEMWCTGMVKMAVFAGPWLAATVYSGCI